MVAARWCEVLRRPITRAAVVGERRRAPYRGSPSITGTGSFRLWVGPSRFLFVSTGPSEFPNLESGFQLVSLQLCLLPT